MQIPLQITFHGVPRSRGVEELIEERASELEKFHRRITGCHVVVASNRRRQGRGTFFSVRVDLIVPGGEIVANKKHRAPPQDQTLEPAIERAFAVARRQLEDYVRRIRGAVKRHREVPTGKVARLSRDKGCGFITTPEGNEIYFHRNAVRGGGFERLAVGDPVQYVEEAADRGPNAASIRPLRRAAARRSPPGAEGEGGRAGARSKKSLARPRAEKAEARPAARGGSTRRAGAGRRSG